MLIEDNQNDDFHRTDLEGGDEPADDEMMAAPEEDALMEEPKDDDYMGEEKAMSEMGYDDGMSDATREAQTKLEEWSYYQYDDGLVQSEKDRYKRQISKCRDSNYWGPFICPCLFNGLFGYLCYYFGTDTPVSLGNEYTQRHMKMNTGFFFFVSATTFFVPFMMRLYSYGKFENNVLRWIVEPFLFTFRLAALVAFVYFIVFQQFIMNFFVGAFFINKANWWKNKTDPWVTNASYLNAFWAWPLMLVAFIWMLYAVLAFVGIGINVILKANFRREFCRFVCKLPLNLWCYLRGLSEQQFKKPFDLLSKTCPLCLKGFTLQDKVITMCDTYNHIYHFKCLAQVVNDAEAKALTPEEATIECGYKGCDFRKCKSGDGEGKTEWDEAGGKAEEPAEAEGALADAPAEAEGALADPPAEAEGAEAEAPAEAEAAEAAAEAEEPAEAGAPAE